MRAPIEFHTERLRLRQWSDGDVEAFAAINADPRVMEHFPSVLSHEATAAGVKRLRSHIEEHAFGFWAVELSASQRFIGFVGLQVLSPLLPFAPGVEIGWRLGHAHWGRGYATEAAKAALRVGFEQLALPEVVSFTAVRNGRSRAVMERIGMKETSETFEHPSVPVGHPVRVHCLYRLSHDEWQKHGV